MQKAQADVSEVISKQDQIVQTDEGCGTMTSGEASSVVEKIGAHFERTQFLLDRMCVDGGFGSFANDSVLSLLHRRSVVIIYYFYFLIYDFVSIPLPPSYGSYILPIYHQPRLLCNDGAINQITYLINFNFCRNKDETDSCWRSRWTSTGEKSSTNFSHFLEKTQCENGDASIGEVTSSKSPTS